MGESCNVQASRGGLILAEETRDRVTVFTIRHHGRLRPAARQRAKHWAELLVELEILGSDNSKGNGTQQ